MKKKKSTLRTWIIMIIVAAIIIAGYFVVSSRKNSENAQPEIEQTEADKLLEKDLTASYPATPREVVKFYSRIMKCFYNEELTEEKMEGLAGQIRKLFDEELLEANPLEEYLLDLQEEINEFKANKRTVTSYQIEKASSVINWTDEEKEYARLIAYYTEKENTQYLKVYEEFVLRKDAEGKWRILGWRLVDGEDMDKD